MKKNMAFSDFQMSIVIRGLLEKCKEIRFSSRNRMCSSGEIPQCLTGHHLPEYV
jgi:hypothetical protein